MPVAALLLGAGFEALAVEAEAEGVAAAGFVVVVVAVAVESAAAPVAEEARPAVEVRLGTTDTGMGRGVARACEVRWAPPFAAAGQAPAPPAWPVNTGTLLLAPTPPPPPPLLFGVLVVAAAGVRAARAADAAAADSAAFATETLVPLAIAEACLFAASPSRSCASTLGPHTATTLNALHQRMTVACTTSRPVSIVESLPRKSSRGITTIEQKAMLYTEAAISWRKKKMKGEGETKNHDKAINIKQT